jgi:hypothetical protein
MTTINRAQLFIPGFECVGPSFRIQVFRPNTTL